jgi:tetratricopeptide (TPR) repeat protein
MFSKALPYFEKAYQIDPSDQNIKNALKLTYEVVGQLEKAKAIRNSLLKKAGEAITYSWSNDFKIKNLNDIRELLTNWEEEYGSFKINPQDLSIEEMKELGFGSKCCFHGYV